MLQPFVNVHFLGDPIYYMTAIFLASQCEFSRFTDKPVEENGYQDVKCYNTDNLLPLQQVALSLCICLSQGLETTWLFLQVGVNRRGSLRGAGMDVVGRKEAATTRGGSRTAHPEAKGRTQGSDLPFSEASSLKRPRWERQYTASARTQFPEESTRQRLKRSF